MNVLFVTYHYLTTTGGGAFASRAYINAFAELAENITLLYPICKGQNTFVGINKKIRLVPIEYNAQKWCKFVNLLLGRVHRYFKAFPQVLSQGTFDIVVFDNSRSSYKMIDIAHNYGCKTIVINHNYEYEYIRDNSRGLLRILYSYWTKVVEKEAVRKTDMNYVLSKQDMILLNNAYLDGKTSSFSLLGVFESTANKYKAEVNNLSDKYHFVITGSLNSFQTKKSLTTWIKLYYPILKEVIPNSTLTIAGKNPDKVLVNLCRKYRICLLASPQSMEPIIWKAGCYICPVYLGGGVKLRVMDGLKAGLPIISHEVSARGYDAFVESGILLTYNDQFSFRKAIETYRTMTIDRKAVRDMYYKNMSFESGVNRLRGILKSLYQLG